MERSQSRQVLDLRHDVVVDERRGGEARAAVHDAMTDREQGGGGHPRLLECLRQSLQRGLGAGLVDALEATISADGAVPGVDHLELQGRGAGVEDEH